MRKLEKQMLAEINASDGIFCATDWCNGSWDGAYTTDKLMRRIYAVMDLGEKDLIVEHCNSWYHSHKVTCLDC